MKKQNVLGLMLATTFALSTLAGCQAPAQTPVPGSQPGAQHPAANKPGGQAAPVAPAKQQAGVQTSQAAAESLNDYQDMEAYDAMANQEAGAARYGVLLYDPSRPEPEEGMVAITVFDGVERDGEVNITVDDGVKRDGEVNITVKGPRLNDKQKKALEKMAKVQVKAEVKAKLEDRQAKQEAKLKARLDKLSDARVKVRDKSKSAGWVAQEDGTEKKSFSFDTQKQVNGKAMGRTVNMERVRSASTKALLSYHVAMSQTLPNGMARTANRDKVLQEDGSYLVTFHGEQTQKDGTKRVTEWTKTIAVDGRVTGEGTITWTDKAGKVTKTVTLGLNGTEEAPEAVAKDAESGTEATVEVAAGGETVAEVKDTATGATTQVDVEAAAQVETTAPQGIVAGDHEDAEASKGQIVEARED